MRKRKFTKRVRQVDMAAVRLDEQGYVRYIGSQLYWMLEIAKVSIPVAARYLEISDNTLYRHIMAEADIKSSLNAKCEAFISLLAFAVRDGTLPLTENDDVIMLQGNEAHGTLANILQPYLHTVIPPIIAEGIIPDYAAMYAEAKEQVTERIKTRTEAESSPRSQSPYEVTQDAQGERESDSISPEAQDTEDYSDQALPGS